MLQRCEGPSCAQAMEVAIAHECCCLQGSNGTPRFWNGSSDAEVFRELLYGLEKSYNEVGEVFGATGLEGMNMSSKMCRGEDGKLYMEIFASKVLQFDVREAGNAVWQYFSRSMEDIPSRLMYQKDSKVCSGGSIAFRMS